MQDWASKALDGAGEVVGQLDHVMGRIAVWLSLLAPRQSMLIHRREVDMASYRGSEQVRCRGEGKVSTSRSDRVSTIR